jgi:glyoxylase-like metal-dependent hydrolase (beta-lactamase superfamily II)
MKLVGVVFAFACIGIAQTVKPEWCKSLPRAEWSQYRQLQSADPWFEVHEVQPGVFAFYEPKQSEETISWLILGRERALLLDTGMGIGDLRRAVRGVTSLPITVLNTHTHNDHVGDNWQFYDVRNFDMPFSHADAKGSLADSQPEIAPGEVCGPLPPGFDRAAYSTKPWSIAGYIHDGERIDLGGRTLTVVATPGHTPDSLSLLDADRGLLFTGDTYYRGTIFLYRPETDLDAYAASMKRMITLVPRLKLLLPAHNAPTQPSELATTLAAFEQVRAGKVVPKPRADGSVEYNFPGFSFRMAK